ncbi:MAG: amidohydrolase family protein [Planctomycetes bacterium]|nr:amidohydrolase family protein [Planctomycetota bacterium]
MKFLPSPSFAATALRLAACVLLLLDATSQAPRTAEPLVITHVKTSLAADAPESSLVIENGRIARILPASAPLPPAMRVIDAKGIFGLPAFVDAASWSACVTPEPKIDQDLPADMRADVQIDMRSANRKGVEPAFRAAAALDFTQDEAKAWRDAGFGALLAAPHGELLAGTSALIVTRDAAARDAVLAPDVFAHAAFAASGQGYPSTLMGYTAQLRQFVLDARHHDELAARALAGRPGPRPAFDPELEAFGAVLRRERRVLAEAHAAADIDRWLALADELGFDVAIVGGNQAFERADVLARRNVPVILTLEWGDGPDDPDAKQDEPKPAAGGEAPETTPAAKPETPPSGEAPQQPQGDAAKSHENAGDKAADTATDAKRFEYVEPLAVRRAKRARWVERRDCAKVLAAKGVRFAFGTANGGASDLLGKVKQLVEAGLARDVALRALTSGAAELLGAPRLGRLEVGMDANVALWTADPLGKDARLAWLVVDGFAHEFDLEANPPLEGKPDEGVDASGTWTLKIEASQEPPETLELTMTPDGKVSGKVRATHPMTQAEITADLAGRVAQKRMQLTTSIDLGQFKIDAAYDGTLSGDAWQGTVVVKGPFGEQKFDFEATRQPK